MGRVFHSGERARRGRRAAFIGASIALALVASSAAAQDRVLVLGSRAEHAELMIALRMELAALGIEPIAGPYLRAAPEAEQVAMARDLARAAGALGALWVHDVPGSPVVLRLWLPVGLREAPIPNVDSDREPRVVALVAASLLEEALYHDPLPALPAAPNPSRAGAARAGAGAAIPRLVTRWTQRSGSFALDPELVALREARGVRPSDGVPDPVARGNGPFAHLSTGPGVRLYESSVAVLQQILGVGVAIDDVRIAATFAFVTAWNWYSVAQGRWVRSSRFRGLSPAYLWGLEVESRRSFGVIAVHVGARLAGGMHEYVLAGTRTAGFAALLAGGPYLTVGVNLAANVEIFVRADAGLVLGEHDHARLQATGALGVDVH